MTFSRYRKRVIIGHLEASCGDFLRVSSSEISFDTEASGENLYYRNISRDVSGVVENSGLTKGIVTVFVTGSTGAVIMIEDEPGLREDLAEALEKIAPVGFPYRHEEAWHDGNGHSHVRASLLGPSITIPFNNSRLALGAWQQLLFVELDIRNRKRTLVVQMIGE